MERLNIIWIIIIEIILTAYAELPTPLRTPQTSGHSSSHISDLPLWSLNRHQVMDQKSSFFICPRVSARFLHCFCTVLRDAMGTLTCKIRQRAQKLHSEKSRCFAQKQRKLETFKIRVTCPVGSFNQRARDSSSLERTKEKHTIDRWKCGANRGLFCFYMLKMGRKMRQKRDKSGKILGNRISFAGARTRQPFLMWTHKRPVGYIVMMKILQEGIKRALPPWNTRWSALKFWLAEEKPEMRIFWRCRIGTHKSLMHAEFAQYKSE